MENLATTPEGSISHGEIEPKLQEGKSDCGPVSVFYILSTFGIKVGYKNLCQELGTNENGTTDTSKIKAVFEKYKLTFEEYQRATIEDLEDALDNGCLCLIEYQAKHHPDYDHDVLWLERKPDVGTSLNHGHYSTAFEYVTETIKGEPEELIMLVDPLIIDEQETPYGKGIRAMFKYHFQKRWERGGREPGWMLVVGKFPK